MSLTLSDASAERGPLAEADHDAPCGKMQPLDEPDVICPICDSWMGGQCGHGPQIGWKEWAEGFDPDHRTNGNLPPPMEPEPPVDLISDAEADRLIDRLASFDERRRRYRAQAEARCRDVDNEEKHLLFVHGTELREWTRSKLRGKSRSVKRPTGTAGFRTVPAHATIFDHAAALAYCEEHLPGAIKPTVDPKKVLTGETGIDGKPLLPPGVEWVPARETFAVRGVRDIEGGGDE
jgi:hypothetical protein